VKTFVPIRTSAMYRAQRDAGARFTDDAGWRVAEVYSSTEDEMARARSGAGLGDASAGGKLALRGETIDALGMKLTGRALPVVGRASRERLNGASVLLCRLAADEVMMLTAAGEHPVVVDVLAGAVQSAGCVHLTDLTAAFAAVDVIGPRLGALFERLVAVDLSAVPVLGVVQCELARVHAIIVRLEHPTLPVFRVLIPREYGDFVWHTLREAGHDLGLTPIGRAAHARLIGH
jgi:glycine cleavage system aminomethyltransferase T